MSEHRDHAYRVALKLKDQPASLRLAALLHEVMDDDFFWGNQMIGLLDPMVGRLVRVLWRGDTEPYDRYIDRLVIKASAETQKLKLWDVPPAVSALPGIAAAMLKIADLEDNLEHMDAEHESLRPRYEKALARLKEAIGDE